MVIYVGADHRGFSLKEALIAYLRDGGYEVIDRGNTQHDEADDYPDFAVAVAREVEKDPDGTRGILICGSGAGMSVVANKFKRVRAGLAASADHVFDARHDDDMNVLAIASDFTSEADARKMVQLFLTTPFAREERFLRRLEKIATIEDSGT